MGITLLALPNICVTDQVAAIACRECFACKWTDDEDEESPLVFGHYSGGVFVVHILREELSRSTTRNRNGMSPCRRARRAGTWNTMHCRAPDNYRRRMASIMKMHGRCKPRTRLNVTSFLGRWLLLRHSVLFVLLRVVTIGTRMTRMDDRSSLRALIKEARVRTVASSPPQPL